MIEREVGPAAQGQPGAPPAVGYYAPPPQPGYPAASPPHPSYAPPPAAPPGYYAPPPAGSPGYYAPPPAGPPGAQSYGSPPAYWTPPPGPAYPVPPDSDAIVADYSEGHDVTAIAARHGLSVAQVYAVIEREVGDPEPWGQPPQHRPGC